MLVRDRTANSKCLERRTRKLEAVFVTLLTIQSIGSFEASATPLHALREADNCAGCHTPDRTQKPPALRRCTLDCAGCHIDPAGAGPRNQWGRYYTHDQLTAIKFRKPADPLKDTSRIDFHYDGRLIQQRVSGKTRSFPMSSEFSIRVRPLLHHLHLIYQNILLGRIDDQMFRIQHEGDRRFRQRYAVMIDALPYNTYVRAYRGQPMYGLRRPNHTLWIREKIGLDQFSTTDAVEVGGTPNVPFLRASYMTGDPYAPAEHRQKGYSFHGGFRGVTLGWHLNTSLWETSSQSSEVSMQAFGAGLNFKNFLVYGETNERHVREVSSASITSSLPRGVHPSSSITEFSLAYAGIRGLTLGSVIESMSDDSRESKRSSIFIDAHPIPHLHLELWYRQESGSRSYSDTIGVIHVYADM